MLASKNIQRKLLSGPASTNPTNPHANIRKLFHEILTYFAKTYSDIFGLTEGPPLHDPIAVAVLLDNVIDYGAFDELGNQRWQVKVITDGMHSDLEQEQGQVGRTVIGLPLQGKDGVRIPKDLDVDKFWEILDGCLSRAEEARALEDMSL